MSPNGIDNKPRLETVAETRAFTADAERLLSREAYDALILAIAADPEGGDLIPSTGGLRKRRVPLPGRGKRGGARVITFWFGERFPVYALLLFAKNERADLTADQKRALLRVVREIEERASARTRK